MKGEGLDFLSKIGGVGFLKVKGAIRQKVGILNILLTKQENNSNIILFMQGRLKNMPESTEFEQNL